MKTPNMSQIIAPVALKIVSPKSFVPIAHIQLHEVCAMWECEMHTPFRDVVLKIGMWVLMGWSIDQMVDYGVIAFPRCKRIGQLPIQKQIELLCDPEATYRSIEFQLGRERLDWELVDMLLGDHDILNYFEGA